MNNKDKTEENPLLQKAQRIFLPHKLGSLK